MTNVEKILVPLAEGFEEIEFTTIVDVLRRADLDVTVASLAPGKVRGSHGIVIEPDACLGDLDPRVFTMIVLPGGQPGTRNLAADERILERVRRVSRETKRSGAICAAPFWPAATSSGEQAAAQPQAPLTQLTPGSQSVSVAT